MKHATEPQSETASRENIRGRRILIVDDHRNIRVSLRLTLESEGAMIVEADTAKSALEKLGRLEKGMTDFPYHAVLLDIRMPDGSGLDVLKEILGYGFASRVIMISGEGTVQDAFQATQMGAFDYIEKPFAPERILVSVARCLDFNRIRSDNETLTRLTKRGIELTGDHPRIKEVMTIVKRVAPTAGRVLIIGESGTGKELVARAIHRESTRSDKPLIKVNCAAIPATLIESELFGHEKGSFTGAGKQRLGVFERADGGSLFLDEIGEVSADVQAKLLRVLQSGEFNRVGGEKTITVDVRLIAATNRDLSEMVKDGSFREDLYYRLNVVTINTPPLRDRASDIPGLARTFLQEACEDHSLGTRTFTENAIKQLQVWRWPGNIRELKNLVERVAILSDDAIIDSIDEISTPPSVATPAPVAPTAAAPDLPPSEGDLYRFGCGVISWDEFHETAGRGYVKHVLRHAKGNVSEAARLLCLERAYLHRLMKKLGIQRDVVVSD